MKIIEYIFKIILGGTSFAGQEILDICEFQVSEGVTYPAGLYLSMKLHFVRYLLEMLFFRAHFVDN